MKEDSVVFVAYRERENLGVGYMIAVLNKAGYSASIIDMSGDNRSVLNEIVHRDPVLVGFSVIFQYHIQEFVELVDFLRKNGIECHFTAGGHYASLRPSNLFEFIPSLDSIVRFEGEYSITDLAGKLSEGKNWRNVNGISYPDDGIIVNNPLRPLELDLDKFPFPYRGQLRDYALRRKYATLLAGRGCIHDCAFCDIREFYRQPPGPAKRCRNPRKVVEEMNYLFMENDCSVFLFQDDDFPVRTETGYEWINEFCDELCQRNLVGKIMWKINCRPDEIDYKEFEMMKANGLFRVFMGIEDGTDQGLNWMNKKLDVSETRAGIDILKDLDISIDYGFMLFQTETTFKSVNNNLDFLELICRDGYMPVSFLKMLPYFETRVERDLKKQGRLKGSPGYLDYDFHEEAMNYYYNFVYEATSTWFNDPVGLLNASKWARNIFSVYNFFYENDSRVKKHRKTLDNILSESNLYLIGILKELSNGFDPGTSFKIEKDFLKDVKNDIIVQHDQYLASIREIVGKILIIARTKELFKV